MCAWCTDFRMSMGGGGGVWGCQIAPLQNGGTLLVCMQGVTTIKWEATVIQHKDVLVLAVNSNCVFQIAFQSQDLQTIYI